MGGAFGTAIFGAVLSTRLAHYLEQAFAGAPGGAAGVGGSLADVRAIQALPPQVKEPVLQSFVLALHDVFLTAIPFLVVAFLVAFLIPEVPLRTRQDGEDEALGEPAPIAFE